MALFICLADAFYSQGAERPEAWQHTKHSKQGEKGEETKRPSNSTVKNIGRGFKCFQTLDKKK